MLELASVERKKENWQKARGWLSKIEKDYPNSLMGEAKAEYVLIVFDSLIKDDFLNAIEKNELKLDFIFY